VILDLALLLLALALAGFDSDLANDNEEWW
jgi:hypothetical protein